MVVAARKAVVVVVSMLTVPKSCLVSLVKRNSNSNRSAQKAPFHTYAVLAIMTAVLSY